MPFRLTTEPSPPFRLRLWLWILTFGWLSGFTAFSFRKPQLITWNALRDQFGQGFGRLRDFRRCFLQTLRQVQAAYPTAQIEADERHHAYAIAGRRLLINRPSCFLLELSCTVTIATPRARLTVRHGHA